MRSYTVKVFMMVVVSFVFSLSSLASSLGSIKGNVSDSEGSAINNAHIIVHADLAGRANRTVVPDQTRETNAEGGYEMQLEPGFYDVCITASAFSPECKKVFVTSSKTSKYDAHLKADPLVSEHLADTF